MASPDELLREGREAFARHDWTTAVERLRAADVGGALDGDGLADLGSAAWWVGEIETSIEVRTRAFSAHLGAGRPEDAAMVAVQLARMHANRGEPAVAAGWLAQAERAIMGRPESAAHVYFETYAAGKAQAGDHPEEALERSERALAIAERVGDRTALALALNRRGAFLVWYGRVEEGLRNLDEAMVAAVGGDLDPFSTGLIYCNTISACAEMADYRRAGEWTEAATRWCERQSIGGFPGICRVYRAEIMQLRGDWAGAESEARRAVEELGGHQLPAIAAAGLYEVGEIRLRMGDTAGADAAFREAHALGHDAQPGRALLQLAAGRADAAAAALTQSLARAESNRLQRARLLPARVAASLATGDPEAARASAEELQAIAESYGSQALLASAAACRARVALSEGSLDQAQTAAREAWRSWRDIEAPYEAARARALLGEILEGAGDAESARLELEAARGAFERLGAVPDAAAAAARIEVLADGDGQVRGVREARTFMFTDIVASTNLVELLGDDAWTDLLAWHDATLRARIAEHGGEVVDTAGDGFFVAFSDAGPAVGCAISIQRTLADHRRAHGFAPQLRIGLHLAEATRHGGSYRGRGVHAAARIGALAEAGQILTSRETLEAAAITPPAGEAKTVSLKGIAEPVEVLAVEWHTA